VAEWASRVKIRLFAGAQQTLGRVRHDDSDPCPPLTLWGRTAESRISLSSTFAGSYNGCEFILDVSSFRQSYSSDARSPQTHTVQLSDLRWVHAQIKLD